MKIKLLAALILFSDICLAKNFGLQGTTYHILEEDLLKVINRELVRLDQTGRLDELNSQFSKRAAESANRPKPVDGIIRTITPTQRKIDPSQTLDTDAILPNGQVIARAGSKINPFDRMTLTKHIVFINGDDEEQVKWAVAYSKLHRSKIVLIQGEPFKLAKKESLQFYFDQAGFLSTKWNIQQVPAVVRQEGRILLIDELKI
ncbi:type-F conjugative transfer system protein TraW [Aeromonas veronii]|nr:type-F conjugative transfer system protein TraW [Aeromonas hydrophila]MBW3834732.1 type-F conjugative transfer system protein TraW [Aeromonas hydrophila]MBW5280292.1 type-F conjugative transfer system protein TraW [Aeromonas hydrophila]